MFVIGSEEERDHVIVAVFLLIK